MSASRVSEFPATCEAGQCQASGLLVEQTHHHAFAVRGRQARDAHVHRAGEPQGDAAVCGMRFSAMSRRAMILMRDTITPCAACGGSSTSRSTPSMRKRTTERLSNGSM